MVSGFEQVFPFGYKSFLRSMVEVGPFDAEAWLNVKYLHNMFSLIMSFPGDYNTGCSDWILAS